MITRVLQSLRDTAWHPDDEQLVAFIDAELGPRESARVRRHLAHCWACRGRERKLTETIDAFMDAYAANAVDEDDEAQLLPHPARLPHAARAALRQRSPAPFAGVRARVNAFVNALVTMCAKESARAVGNAARHPYVRPATIARVGVACTTAAIIVLLSTGVPLSARQVVRHVDRAERGVLATTPAPVVYQRLDIAVRQLPRGMTTRGTFELWTDVERHRSRVEESDDALAELLALFARHGMTSAWPVSLRSYEQLRGRAAGDDADAVEERVVREQAADGERLLTLEATAVEARDRSIDTRLVVRERDWHPIEQRLTVREGSETTEFVVRERGFEVIPLATLPVAFFDAPPPSLPVVEEARATTEAPRLALPAASELVSAEVQAMFALHRAGLTAEDDIAVQQRESAIEVSGLTTTEARRRQLTDAIAGIRHVRVRIKTTGEALSEVSGMAPASAAAGSANGLPSAGRVGQSSSGGAASTVQRAGPGGVAAESGPPALRFDEAAIDATRLPVQALGGQNRPADRGADEASLRRAREAVRQSLTLLERAWALRRLAEWSRRTNASAVTVSTRELIDVMVREHADAASKALAALDTIVTPTLPAAAPAPPESAATPDTHAGAVTRGANDRASYDRVDDGRSTTYATRAWVDVATDFFGVAAEIDRDTRRLFTASPTPTTETEAADEARRLRVGLDRAARSLLELRQPQAPSQP